MRRKRPHIILVKYNRARLLKMTQPKDPRMLINVTDLGRACDKKKGMCYGWVLGLFHGCLCTSIHSPWPSIWTTVNQLSISCQPGSGAPNAPDLKSGVDPGLRGGGSSWAAVSAWEPMVGRCKQLESTLLFSLCFSFPLSSFIGGRWPVTFDTTQVCISEGLGFADLGFGK